MPAASSFAGFERDAPKAARPLNSNVWACEARARSNAVNTNEGDNLCLMNGSFWTENGFVLPKLLEKWQARGDLNPRPLPCQRANRRRAERVKRFYSARIKFSGLRSQSTLLRRHKRQAHSGKIPANAAIPFSIGQSRSSLREAFRCASLANRVSL
jgi:hypothetical protein